MNTLKALGRSENDKILIINADDTGLSHSENMATIQALKKGRVNSYSIVIPRPWSYEMPSYIRHFAAMKCAGLRSTIQTLDRNGGN